MPFGFPFHLFPNNVDQESHDMALKETGKKDTGAKSVKNDS